MDASPEILVFAGPNGSGKSSITKRFPIVGLYINADEIKKRANCSDLEAAQEAEKIREYCLQHKTNFTFETVLSTRRNLDLLHRAKAAGYKITSVYVTTANVQLNILRVRSRVANGGHDVPSEKIISRYTLSMKNIKELVSLSDVCIVVDNTGSEAEIIFSKENERMDIQADRFWTIDQIKELIL